MAETHYYIVMTKSLKIIYNRVGKYQSTLYIVGIRNVSCNLWFNCMSMWTYLWYKICFIMYRETLSTYNLLLAYSCETKTAKNKFTYWLCRLLIYVPVWFIIWLLPLLKIWALTRDPINWNKIYGKIWRPFSDPLNFLNAVYSISFDWGGHISFVEGRQ